ncbi:hypothetical protein [Streptomyces sp. NPDC059278]|uniref:hypothetical protein n=1 Tax=Streptomyces sp. NPDC059278 TaxID=3346801 RepID=UPI00368C808A
MPPFLLGMFLGVVSGASTYWLPADRQMPAVAALIAAALIWLGLALFLASG